MWSSTAASSEIEGDGFFVGPTLLDNVTPEMDVYRDEIFGPVLASCASTRSPRRSS